MSYDELREAYDQAVSDYAAAKAGHGNRLVAFIQFLSAERALVARTGDVIAGNTPNAPLSWPPCLRIR